MSTTDFNSILSLRADTVEAPKRLPPGKYEALVKDFKSGISDKKRTPFIEFTMSIVRPLDLPPEFEASAGEALGKGPVDLRYSFFLTDKSLYHLIDFLEQDLQITKSGQTVGEMVTKAQGRSCSVILDEETSEKTGKSYVNIKATGAL